MTSTHWDAIVIGGGAAGLSAAQALGRSLRRTLVIDGGQPRNRFADHMHNVLGLDGTPPFELTARGRAEAEQYGVEFRNTLVRTVADEGATLAVHLTDGTTQHARAVIVATGITDVLPDIPGIAERWGRPVLHCPYCHGWEVRGRRLGVIATSPVSLHQARLVRQWSDDVTVFTAGIGDLDAAVARDFAARDVRIVTAPVVEVSGDGATVRTNDETTDELDAVFTGGLMHPHDTFLDDLALERAETPLGSFIRTDLMQRTSHPRVFAAGNVINPSAAVPIAMATGMTAGAAVNAVLVDEDFALAEPATAEPVG